MGERIRMENGKEIERERIMRKQSGKTWMEKETMMKIKTERKMKMKMGVREKVKMNMKEPGN